MIGKMVQRLREAQGWSQQRLAELAGVGQSHISDIEGNRKMPSVKVLQKLADVFGVPVGQFFEEGGN